MTNVRTLSPPEWCGTDPDRHSDPALCETFYAPYLSGGQEVVGACYHDGSRCRLGVGVTCSPPPPPPPIPVPHAEWTSLSSLPAIAIADDEEHAAFLNRCKDTCLGSADCIGFVEAGCDQAGCTLCEFRGAAGDLSYVVPAPQTYLWLGGASRASRTGEAGAASLDTYPYDDGVALLWSDASSDDEGQSSGEAGTLAFSPTEFAAVISATLLSGALLGGALALACSRCKARLAARSSGHKAQPSVPLPPHYFKEGLAVKPEANTEPSSERSFGSAVSANV